MDICQKIEAAGIVPVVKLTSAEHAVPLCQALIAGGLSVAEITFRTDAAEESIRRVAKELPDMLVGAGTVLSIEQAKIAWNAGAQFIVTPGFNPDVVGWCVDNKIPVFPGCPTTSDIEQALKFGLKIVKFFPAEAMGGLNTIKAVSAPYGNIRFMPTGGINENNMLEYLSYPKIVACGGSWMVKDELIVSGRFAEITELTRTAVNKLMGFEICHIGINSGDEKEASKIAKGFSALFGWKVKEGISSYFAGTSIEVMKKNYLGAKGHIAVGTNSISRAKVYLENLGVIFNESTAKFKNDKLVAIYLNEELGGFAIHLFQKNI